MSDTSDGYAYEKLRFEEYRWHFETVSSTLSRMQVETLVRQGWRVIAKDKDDS